MLRHFVLYLNDSSIKVYHANKNNISFYKKYSIEDSKGVDGMVSLLNKHARWTISLYIETSEVVIEKKVFSKRNAKDIKSIISNYIQRPDCIMSCAVSNDQYGLETKKLQNSKEYVILSVPESSSYTLKSVISALSNNRNKIKMINFLPINLGLSNIVKNEFNTVNTLVRLRKDGTYAIDVFYGFSFIIHREDFLESKANLKHEIINTISYIETIVTNTNIKFVTTIISEVSLTEEQTNGIKSDKLNIIQKDNIISSFGSKNKLAKNSESQIDDSILAILFGSKYKHNSFINSLLSKKALFFKVLPMSYIAIFLFFVILLGTELNSIFIKLPETIRKIAAAEQELITVDHKLNDLKKIVIDPQTLSYVTACANLESVDLKKANYIKIVDILNNISKKYNKELLFNKYSFVCSGNCQDNNTASYTFNASGQIFNTQGNYESMVSIVRQIRQDIKNKFNNYLVSMPDESKITPKLGGKYDGFSFDLSISNNAVKTR